MARLASRLTGLTIVIGALSGCDGDAAVGDSALVSVAREAAGANCPTGGVSITSGRDKNRNGELDAAEVESTLYSCNGADGAKGSSGTETAGPAGSDGHSALVIASPEPVGTDCPAGGQRIDQGIDSNDNGELEAGEVVSTATVCSGQAGDAGQDALASLINVTSESPSANCATGGQKIESGLDADGDGELAGSEVEKVAYFCNGADGEAGLDSLSKLSTEAAGANCADGGVRVDLGLDDDADDVLDDAEIDVTSYACNGSDGLDGVNSLVAVVDEAAGSNCAAGGEKVTYGLDADGSGTLDAGEVAGTRYVCDGAAGSDGVDALVIVAEVVAGATCTYGGQRIVSGRDADGSGTLEAGEVENTTYVCNGEP
ncbi:MAG: Phage tail fiber protein [Polyangiaceae bacterium]|jgi:hypothetical protein|nr:Phage tail fiber protein [Polyangiaceae bacterium]